MAALTSDRKRQELFSGLSRKVAYTPAGVATYFAGGMLMLGADDGTVKPASGSASANTKACVVGIANDHAVVNATTPYAFQKIEVLEGIFGMAAGTGINALSGAMAGQLVYASDDQTVNATSGPAVATAGSWPIAGRLVDYDTVTSTAFVLMGASHFRSGSAG